MPTSEPGLRAGTRDLAEKVAGPEITDQARTRITGCSDLSLLETWSDRALVATTLEDVFSPG